jgi:hypothetical protein
MGDKDADHQTGKRFGYGLWLQPIINANDQSDAASGETSPPPPQRRGRGRPPINKPRSDSAIEVYFNEEWVLEAHLLTELRRNGVHKYERLSARTRSAKTLPLRRRNDVQMNCFSFCPIFPLM